MDKTLDLDEAIARLIDPSSWRVFDSELERVKRHHPNGGYDPDNFKDRASLALAGRILALIAAARPAVVSDEVVEAMCEAYEAEFGRTYFKGRAARIAAMRAALALLPGGVPDGWVLVPKEPTEAMVNAVWHHWLHGMGHSQECMRDALRAMLSASPKGSPRSLPSRTAQEPPSPTPCDLEGGDQ